MITNTITHNQVFVMDAFLPAIRSASSHHFLGLTDRLELLTNTVFTVAKLLYAFVWQVRIFETDTVPTMNERYYRLGIVSRILALFGKYRISRYQGNLARFLWSQLPSLKYSLSLSSGSTGCSHLRKTVWLGKSWQSINYLEVTYWLFSIYSKNTLQVQYFANSPSYHLSSFFRVFFLLGTSPN